MQMFVHEARWLGMEASKCLDHTVRLFRSHFSCRVALTAEEPVCCGLVAGSTVLLLLRLSCATASVSATQVYEQKAPLRNPLKSTPVLCPKPREK